MVHREVAMRQGTGMHMKKVPTYDKAIKYNKTPHAPALVHAGQNLYIERLPVTGSGTERLETKSSTMIMSVKLANQINCRAAHNEKTLEK